MKNLTISICIGMLFIIYALQLYVLGNYPNYLQT